MSFPLRDYQVEGVERLIRTERQMCTDAPGLGKTAQMALAAELPALVIARAKLVPQWVEWMRGEDPSSLERNKGLIIPNVPHADSISIAVGNPTERLSALQAGSYWTVVSLETLSGVHSAFLKKARNWTTIIIDESHHLKSHRGIRAKVAVEMSKRSKRVYLGTATPIKREIDDLYMQFRIIQPGIFTSYWDFVKQFCISDSTFFGTEIRGPKKSSLPELHRIMGMLSFGRSYKDVGRVLPEVIEKYVPIKLDTKTRTLYNELRDHWRSLDEANELIMTNYIEVMHLLRQFFTGSFKAEFIAELLEDLPEEDRAIVFTWYQWTAEQIGKRLGVPYLTGQMPEEMRMYHARNAHRLVANIGAVGEGINGMETSKQVVFAEEDWTPGTNYQALGRVRRDLGDEAQDKEVEPIVVTYVYVENSIDTVIHKKSKSRAMTAKEVVKEALYL